MAHSTLQSCHRGGVRPEVMTACPLTGRHTRLWSSSGLCAYSNYYLSPSPWCSGQIMNVHCLGTLVVVLSPGSQKSLADVVNRTGLMWVLSLGSPLLGRFPVDASTQFETNCWRGLSQRIVQTGGRKCHTPSLLGPLSSVCTSPSPCWMWSTSLLCSGGGRWVGTAAEGVGRRHWHRRHGTGGLDGGLLPVMSHVNLEHSGRTLSADRQLVEFVQRIIASQLSYLEEAIVGCFCFCSHHDTRTSPDLFQWEFRGGAIPRISSHRLAGPPHTGPLWRFHCHFAIDSRNELHGTPPTERARRGLQGSDENVFIVVLCALWSLYLVNKEAVEHATFPVVAFTRTEVHCGSDGSCDALPSWQACSLGEHPDRCIELACCTSFICLAACIAWLSGVSWYWLDLQGF